MSEPQLFIKARTNYYANPPASYKRDADYWGKDTSTNLFYMSGNIGIGYANFNSGLIVNGNVGIGTSFALAQLDVSGNSYFNGAMGIGVASPKRLFHVQGNNAIWRLDRDANTVGLQLHRFPSNDFTTPWKGFLIGVEASGINNGNFLIADYGTAVGGGATTRLLIDNSGNIGIGTSNPQAKLHVIDGYVYAEPPITIIEDQKAVGTQGGSSSATTWNIRTLNTLVTNTIGVTLSSNIFTIPPGRYHITVSTPAYKVGRHKCRLYNVTTSSVSAYGTNSYILETINVQTDSNLDYVFTITTSTQFRIEHWTTFAQAANGLGVDFNQTPAVEVYTRVKLIKYA